MTVHLGWRALARWTVISAALAVVLARPATAAISFLPPAADDRPALDTAMPSLADTVLATLHEEDRRLDLVTRFRLQMVTGRWSVVIRAAKSPFVEINYGTPEPVAYETIADAGAPLKITILSDSAIDIPTRPIS